MFNCTQTPYYSLSKRFSETVLKRKFQVGKFRCLKILIPSVTTESVSKNEIK